MFGQGNPKLQRFGQGKKVYAQLHLQDSQCVLCSLHTIHDCCYSNDQSLLPSCGLKEAALEMEQIHHQGFVALIRGSWILWRSFLNSHGQYLRFDLHSSKHSSNLVPKNALILLCVQLR